MRVSVWFSSVETKAENWFRKEEYRIRKKRKKMEEEIYGQYVVISGLHEQLLGPTPLIWSVQFRRFCNLDVHS